jgi:hypothetical protein
MERTAGNMKIKQRGSAVMMMAVTIIAIGVLVGFLWLMR